MATIQLLSISTGNLYLVQKARKFCTALRLFPTLATQCLVYKYCTCIHFAAEQFSGNVTTKPFGGKKRNKNIGFIIYAAEHYSDNVISKKLACIKRTRFIKRYIYDNLCQIVYIRFAVIHVVSRTIQGRYINKRRKFHKQTPGVLQHIRRQFQKQPSVDLQATVGSFINNCRQFYSNYRRFHGQMSVVLQPPVGSFTGNSRYFYKQLSVFSQATVGIFTNKCRHFCNNCRQFCQRRQLHKQLSVVSQATISSFTSNCRQFCK